MFFVTTRGVKYGHQAAMTAETLDEAFKYVASMMDGQPFGEIKITNETKGDSFIMSICSKKVRVDWVSLLEGYNGDYDPNDKEDEALLRFDVYKWEDGDWAAVEDASYCTCMPVNCGTEPAEIALRRIHAAYSAFFDLYPDAPVKRLGEQLSHIGA